MDMYTNIALNLNFNTAHAPALSVVSGYDAQAGTTALADANAHVTPNTSTKGLNRSTFKAGGFGLGILSFMHPTTPYQKRAGFKNPSFSKITLRS